MLLSLALLSVCNDGYLVLSQGGSPSSTGIRVHIQPSSRKNNQLEGIYYFIRRGSAKLICFPCSEDSFLVDLFSVSSIMWTIRKIQPDLPSSKVCLRKLNYFQTLGNLLLGTLFEIVYAEVQSLPTFCATHG